MTPCQKLGYQEGDEFIYKGRRAELFNRGFLLFRDDGSKAPLFKSASSLFPEYHTGYIFVFSLDEVEGISVRYNE